LNSKTHQVDNGGVVNQVDYPVDRASKTPVNRPGNPGDSGV
jgi:hypothetical protein